MDTHSKFRVDLERKMAVSVAPGAARIAVVAAHAASIASTPMTTRTLRPSKSRRTATRSRSVYTFEQAETVAERAGSHPHLGPGGEDWTVEVHETFGILTLLQFRNHLVGDDSRLIAMADQMGDAEGRTDGAPSLRRPVDQDEHIAGKQGRRDDFYPPRMPPALAVARKENREP